MLLVAILWLTWCAILGWNLGSMARNLQRDHAVSPYVCILIMIGVLLVNDQFGALIGVYQHSFLSLIFSAF